MSGVHVPTAVPADIENLLAIWAQCLRSGDPGAFLDSCALPLAVYLEDNIIVHHTRDDLHRAVREMIEHFSVPGLIDVKPGIEEISKRKRGRQTVVVRWHMLMVPPQPSRCFVERYMVTVTEPTGKILLSMIEHIGAPPVKLEVCS